MKTTKAKPEVHAATGWASGRGRIAWVEGRLQHESPTPLSWSSFVSSSRQHVDDSLQLLCFCEPATDAHLEDAKVEIRRPNDDGR